MCLLFFVFVYFDGDIESVQKFGECFKVYGYLMMILFCFDGIEVMWLLGEVDFDCYMQVLLFGMMVVYLVWQMFVMVLKNGVLLMLDEWCLLVDYLWDIDGVLLVLVDCVVQMLQLFV